MRIAVSGAGIAGPTLAYWLLESGHEALLVETSPRLGSGGYVIDFWGVGYDIAEVEGYRPRDGLRLCQPRVAGRQISRFSIRDDKTLFLFIFRDEYLTAGSPPSERERKAVLTSLRPV